MGRVDEAAYESGRSGPPMTVDGAVGKTALLLALSMATASATWGQMLAGHAAAALAASKVAGLVAMASAIATMLKPQWAPATAPLFAAAKGVALAGFSAMLEAMFPGIVMQSLFLTFGTAGSLLLAYRMRIIRVTDRFRDGVVTATGGYFLAMLLAWAASMFGMRLPLPGPLAIGVGLLSTALAASHLLLDFQMLR